MRHSVLRYHQEAIVSAMRSFVYASQYEGFLHLSYTAEPHFVIEDNVFVVRPQAGVVWETLYDEDKVEALSDVFLLGVGYGKLVEHPLGQLAGLTMGVHTAAFLDGCHDHNDLVCRDHSSYVRCDFAAEQITHYVRTSRNN